MISRWSWGRRMGNRGTLLFGVATNDMNDEDEFKRGFA